MAKSPKAAFLFAKLFLCACGIKEKADYRFSICNNLLIEYFVNNLMGIALIFCTSSFASLFFQSRHSRKDKHYSEYFSDNATSENAEQK